MNAFAEEQDPVEGWRIEDLGEADWALLRLAELEREMEENTRITNGHIDKLQQRCQALNATVMRRAEFFRSALAAYAESHRAELLGGGKKKSRTLPHGSLGWRKKGGLLEVRDKVALLDWARSQPVELNLVRIKEDAALDEIKLHFGRTGELPPGTDVSPERDEVVVRATMGGPDGSAEQ